MEIIADNIYWMSINISLAIFGVLTGSLMVRTKRPFVQIFAVLAWILFVPNTLYIVTDLKHIARLLPFLDPFYVPLFVVQFIILITAGLVSFLLAMYPLEIIFRKKMLLYPVLFVANFILAYGLVLGRIYRINSWYIVIHPLKVLMAAQETLYSAEYMLYVAAFGLLANLIYFLFRRGIPTLPGFSLLYKRVK